MLDDLLKIKLLGLASGQPLQVERTKEATVVTGFIPEWNEFADVAQDPPEVMASLLKMTPITNNTASAAFRMSSVAGWQMTDGDGHLVFDNKGLSWYLFLTPDATEEQIGQAAVTARMKIIHGLMTRENANDSPVQQR